MTEFDPLTALTSRLLADDIIRRVDEYESTRRKLKGTGRIVPYISKQQALKELDITDNTLTNWEKHGLRRYKPNYKTSLVYYLIDDISKFIVLSD
ncbi:hypothetical protein [Pseudolactococcus insecticola]|uniref:Phage protein n=1 Tax=Pseudolactococcus insecticola TaxID=2709158 RepID=A0A6A0BC86_9LACT|nr:hypothetical protein [Lactococcus insecticola]GFH41437.1 hypothetical protein Hs20B_18350 [Lactococcus insecticola]